jgi:hypothetical protein
MTEIKELVGKVLSDIKFNICVNGGEIIFIVNSKEQYRVCHWNGYCASIYMDDISSLIGNEILFAEEVGNCRNLYYPQNNTDIMSISSTWAFYKISSIKGLVTIRLYSTRD